MKQSKHPLKQLKQRVTQVNIVGRVKEVEKGRIQDQDYEIRKLINIMNKNYKKKKKRKIFKNLVCLKNPIRKHQNQKLKN